MRAEKGLGAKAIEASELLNLIPVSKLESIAEALQSDKWVPKLKSATMFQRLLLSVLEHDRLSLRLMEEPYNSPSFQLRINGSVDARTAHSSLCDRLKTIQLDYFKNVYEEVYGQVSHHYSSAQLKHYNLKRYDSTMIRVFSHLLEGMRVGNTSKNKHQVKFTTEHDPNAIQVIMYVTLIAAMLVLIFKKKKGLPSFKIAKKRFSKEIEAALLLEILQTPEGVEIYKTFLKNQVQNQYDTKQTLRKRTRNNADAAGRPAP
jgi:hypothetical protein